MASEIKLHQLPEYKRATIWAGDDKPFSDFILSGVQDNISETMAIHNTRDKFWVKGMGYEPSFKIYNGIIPIDSEFDFQELYLDKWRASKCIENNTTVKFKYSNVLNIGVMESLTIKIENNLRYATFQMRQLVTDTMYINDYNEERRLDDELKYLNRPLDIAFKAVLTRTSRKEGYQSFVLSDMTKNYHEKLEYNDRGGTIGGQYPNYNTSTTLYTYGQHPITYTLGLYVTRELLGKVIENENEESEEVQYEITTGETEFYREYIRNYSISQKATDICLYYMNRCAVDGIIMNPGITMANNDTIYIQLNFVTNKREYYLFSYLNI